MAKNKPKSKREPGRPSKFTPEVVDRLLNAIRAGATYEVACDHAGIAYSTLRSWIVAAEESRNDQAKMDLLEAIKKAEADAEVANIALIRKAASDGQWQAAAWILERRHPERWARRERTDQQHSGQVEIIVKRETLHRTTSEN